MIIELTFLVLAILISAQFIFLSYRFEKLLRQIRKLAALYPPYPLAEDDERSPRDTSHVKIEPLWNEEAEPRD